ncbi:hypothetical protein [Flavobacterium sp. A45]|uniref:hypothetical protein n=1 Tax=Flavobacterium sp. A45 TaxID=1945862 RepID=UPI00098444A0|nr:hypothetical protein [Flavobacterium sp. A45]OOG77984.1 hypothetical protein B0E44_01510 [Flavobacterium sp. A45]
MKNNVFNIFLSLIIVTFSLIWISDKLSVLVENEKYSYFETTEKGDSENQTENKLKTLFVSQIDYSNFGLYLLPNSKDINSLYSFTVKEFCFKNLTPPPEKV